MLEHVLSIAQFEICLHQLFTDKDPFIAAILAIVWMRPIG